MKKSCPVCDSPVNTAFQPFCSARCKDVDLGRWFNGSYVIEGREHPDEDDVVEAIETGNFKGELPKN